MSIQGGYAEEDVNRQSISKPFVGEGDLAMRSLIQVAQQRRQSITPPAAAVAAAFRASFCSDGVGSDGVKSSYSSSSTEEEQATSSSSSPSPSSPVYTPEPERTTPDLELTPVSTPVSTPAPSPSTATATSLAPSPASPSEPTTPTQRRSILQRLSIFRGTESPATCLAAAENNRVGNEDL